MPLTLSCIYDRRSTPSPEAVAHQVSTSDADRDPASSVDHDSASTSAPDDHDASASTAADVNLDSATAARDQHPGSRRRCASW